MPVALSCRLGQGGVFCQKPVLILVMWRLLVILLLLPASAIAGETKNTVTAQNQTKYFTADAHCRDSNGQRREIGEVICITASCLTWI